MREIMNKKIIAGLVFSIASTGAFAQSSVTVYGIVDAALTAYRGVENADGDKHSKIGIDSGIYNGSRIGFKGTEDLGGGTSAIFNIEAGFLVDDGQSDQSGTLFGRQAIVGLSDESLGELTVGRQYSVLDDITGYADAFENTYTGGVGNLVAYDDRVNNSISYSTPSYAGLSARVIYGFGEQAGAGSKGSHGGVSFTYQNDEAYFSLGYAKSNYENDADNTSKDRSQLMLGASFDLDVVRLYGLFSNSKEAQKVAGEDALKYQVYSVGVAAPFGPSTVMFSVGMLKDKTNGAKDANAKQFALGYNYTLSKRTSFYATYAAIKNDDNAGYKVLEEGTQGLAIGVSHSF